ncbi:MAG: glycosyltransferase family 4 protein [Anaeromyxobacteraceae bacterium]
MGLSIAYANYGEQSGVTTQVARTLELRGHRVTPVEVFGTLDLRDRRTRWPRPTPAVLAHLAISAARFGGRALAHRFNTPFAFDLHSREAGAALDALASAPEVVLQNGALFAPGLPPRLPYALLLDHTRALAMRARPFPEAGLLPPVDYGPGWREREARTYRGARALATFSENAARSLVDDYGVDPERVHVVGAGANVFPATAPRDDDGRTIAFVGREFARKGGRVLLEAFARVRHRLPGARLLIAGPPSLPDPLPAGATLLGPVPYEGLPALFARTTVFALPTLQEPFGLAFLDAMACGLPCVGTALEAVPEILGHGACGLLVPPGDPAALADALSALLAEPARARTLGSRGRQRVASRFLWPLVAERLERVLEAAVGGREGSASARPG